jgi:hypothetical protein
MKLPKKIDKVYQKLLEVFQKNKTLDVKELLILYGHLGYTLGASIGGYTGKGPGVPELTKKYMEEPTIDTALMLQGLQTILWAEDLGKKLDEIKKDLKDESEATTV